MSDDQPDQPTTLAGLEVMRQVCGARAAAGALIAMAALAKEDPTEPMFAEQLNVMLEDADRDGKAIVATLTGMYLELIEASLTGQAMTPSTWAMAYSEKMQAEHDAIARRIAAWN